ncbi:hypothetical protein CYMTET_53158 [Cymbomonas tetramitiformis]|uniref:Cyclic nucleotide-binding domain-containing protein n=1 Tax=Cymbomonas tetramitiformis TaxID=36881 RepID=A0AAE0BIV7_9CHLO|nr:hypothetical protein CYMTET_53158 [Cymbomonas tetramitiformis]
MAFTTFLLVLNPTLVAYTTSQVSSIVFEGEKSKAEEQEYNARMVKMVKSSSGLPPELTKEIVRATTMASESRGRCSIDELYTLMSFALRIKVARFIGRGTLNKVPVLRGCSPQFLDLLAVVMRELSAHKDEMLFEQDAAADTIYIIVHGKVQETQTEPKPHTAIKGPGTSVGELPVLLGNRHTTTAQVKGAAAQLFTVKREELVRLLLDFPNDETALHQECLRCFIGEHGGEDRCDSRSEYGSRPTSAAGSAHSRATSVESIADNSNFSSAIIHRISVMMRQNRLASITKLCQCAKAGNLDHMKQLFETSNIELDDADTNGRTLLAVAASEGQVEVVRYLLDRGASGSIKDINGNTPLNDAVREGHHEVAMLLKAKGFKLDYPELDMAGMLCEVAYSESIEKMRQLVLHGCDINLADYDGRTALMLAASSGRLEMVSLLLGLGADMAKQDRFGNTALDDAVREKHLEVQKVLCEAGARLRDRGIQLCDAAAEGDLETLVVLCKNGANANDGDYDKRTGLHLAASNGHNDCVDFLLAQPGIDINTVDNFGGTPLDDALRHQNSAIVVMLTKRGGVQGSHSSVQARIKEEEEAQQKALQERIAASADRMQTESKEETMYEELEDVFQRLKSCHFGVNGALERLRGQLGIAPFTDMLPAERQDVRQLVDLTTDNSMGLVEAANNTREVLEEMVEVLQTSQFPDHLLKEREGVGNSVYFIRSTMADNEEIKSAVGQSTAEVPAVAEESQAEVPAPEPLREDMLQNAVSFLTNAKVRSASTQSKRDFLAGKGLTEAEIDEGFRRAGDSGADDPVSLPPSRPPPPRPYPPPAASTASGAAYPPPAPLQNTAPPAPQAPEPFRWTQAVLMAGGAVAGVVLLKNSLAPYIKPAICRMFPELQDTTTSTGEAQPVQHELQSALSTQSDELHLLKLHLDQLNKSLEQDKLATELKFAEAKTSAASLRDFTSTIQSELTQIKSSVAELSSAASSTRKAAEPDLRSELADLKSMLSSQVAKVNPPSAQSPVAEAKPAPGSSVGPPPPHPQSYNEVLEMLQKGETPPGIRDINDKPPNPNQEIPEPQLKRKPKPWERDYVSSTAGTSTSFFGDTPPAGSSSTPPTASDKAPEASSAGGGGWRPPPKPMVAMPAAAAAIGFGQKEAEDGPPEGLKIEELPDSAVNVEASSAPEPSLEKQASYSSITSGNTGKGEESDAAVTGEASASIST